MEDLLKQLQEGKDPYRQLAAYVMGKKLDDVTRDERQRFKEAFYAAFHFRGPDIIKNCFEDLRELDKLPTVREHLRKKAREQ